VSAAEARPIDGELARLNQALYDEYVRITGQTGRREFGEFVCVIEGQLAERLQVPVTFLRAHDSPVASAYRLLEHLRAQPPIVWPCLDLRRA
jgi:hypothetical protein